MQGFCPEKAIKYIYFGISQQQQEKNKGPSVLHTTSPLYKLYSGLVYNAIPVELLTLHR